jgi:FHA domain
MASYRLMTRAGNIPLADKPIMIGSSPDCDIRAEGPEVASHHVKISARGDESPLIEPVSPDCLVLINGKAIDGPTRLDLGSSMRVGTTDINLEMGTATALVPILGRKRPLWKRLLKWGLISASALLLLLIIAAALLPIILNEARVKATIKEALESSLRRDVSIDRVSLRLLKGIKITNLVIANKEGFTPDTPLLSVRKADVRVDVWELLASGFSSLKCTLVISDPAIFIEREAQHGETNISDLLQASSDGKDSPTPDNSNRVSSKDLSVGPFTKLNVTLQIKNGSLEFDDRLQKTNSRFEKLSVKARLKDFDAPGLKGLFSYQINTELLSGGDKGKCVFSGKSEFEFALDKSTPLGLRIKQLTGELLKADLTAVNASSVGRHFNLPGLGRDAEFEFTMAAASAQDIKITANLDIPRLDTVALGINNDPKKQVALAMELTGESDLIGGNLNLNLSGQSSLFEKLIGSVKIVNLPALIIASTPERGTSGPASDSISINLETQADIGKLTGGNPGRIFGARDRVDGQLSFKFNADGSAAKLLYKLGLDLKGLSVPPQYTGGQKLPPEDIILAASGNLVLDPKTLKANSGNLQTSITSGAITGEIKRTFFARSSASKSASAGGELTLKANLQKFADRYGQVLSHLPRINEQLSLKVSAAGQGGPIKLQATLTSSRAYGQPNPIIIAAQTAATPPVPGGPDKGWTFPGTVINIRTPQSKAIDLKITGELKGLGSTATVFSSRINARADLATLWKRASGIFGQIDGLRGLTRFKLTGQLKIKDGIIEGSPEKITSALVLDLLSPSISGEGLQGDVIRDSRLQVVANCDLTPATRHLEVRALKLESSFCSLDLTGRVTNYQRMLGSYRLNLNIPDAGKTSKLLGVLGLLRKGLRPKGTASILLTADTARGILAIERFLVDTDQAKINLSGKLSDFRIESLLDTKSGVNPFANASGVLTLEELSADVSIFHQLRNIFPDIPEDLKGSGLVKIKGALSTTKKGVFGLKVSLNATPAALSFSGLIDKPAGTRAEINIAGQWKPATTTNSLQMTDLRLALADFSLKGSGSADLSIKRAAGIDGFLVEIAVPAFKPDELRKIFPALKDFRFGGSLELKKLRASGSLKQLLAGKEGLFTGRLAGLALNGEAHLKNLAMTYAGMPNMKAHLNGSLVLSPDQVLLQNLLIGIVSIKSHHDTRIVVRKGRLTPVKKDTRILSNLMALSGTLDISSPEINIDQLLSAIELPLSTENTVPAGKQPGPEASSKSNIPAYAFLKGHRFTGSIKVDRVTYDRYSLTELTADLNLKDNLLHLSKLKARTYQGQLLADVGADLNKLNIAHNSTLELKQLSVNSAAANVLGYKDIFDGKLSGKLKLTGTGLMPGKTQHWKGSGQLAIKGGTAKNLEKFPLFGSNITAMADTLAGLPLGIKSSDILKEFKDKTHSIDPASIKLTLKMQEGQPVLSLDTLKLTTVSKDPLKLGLRGGFALLADQRGDRTLSKGTRLTFWRIPDSWLRKAGAEKVATLKKTITKEAAAGKLYFPTSGSLAKPRPDVARVVKMFSRIFIKALPGALLGNKADSDKLDDPDKLPGKIIITSWKTGGNFLKPKVKIQLTIKAPGATKLCIYAQQKLGDIENQDRRKNIKCIDGQNLKIETSYPFGITKALDLRIYDKDNKVIARYVRKVGM